MPTLRPLLPGRIRRQDPLLLMVTLIVGNAQVLTIRNIWLCLGSEAMIELMNDIRPLAPITRDYPPSKEAATLGR